MGVGTDMAWVAVFNNKENRWEKGEQIGYCSVPGRKPKQMTCCRWVKDQLKTGMRIFINNCLVQVGSIRKNNGGFSIDLKFLKTL